MLKLSSLNLNDWPVDSLLQTHAVKPNIVKTKRILFEILEEIFLKYQVWKGFGVMFSPFGTISWFH